MQNVLAICDSVTDITLCASCRFLWEESFREAEASDTQGYQETVNFGIFSEKVSEMVFETRLEGNKNHGSHYDARPLHSWSTRNSRHRS